MKSISKGYLLIHLLNHLKPTALPASASNSATRASPYSTLLRIQPCDVDISDASTHALQHTQSRRVEP